MMRALFWKVSYDSISHKDLEIKRVRLSYKHKGQRPNGKAKPGPIALVARF